MTCLQLAYSSLQLNYKQYQTIKKSTMQVIQNVKTLKKHTIQSQGEPNIPRCSHFIGSTPLWSPGQMTKAGLQALTEGHQDQGQPDL